VIVTGEFDSTAAQAKIAKAFGEAPAGKSSIGPLLLRLLPKRSCFLSTKPDATQTYFYIGQPGVDRRNPDRTKLLILNTLFGDVSRPCSTKNCASNSGLTYGANSTVQQVRLPASIMITTFTKTETTVQAMDMALDILKRLVEKGITADQLASAKAYIKGTYPPQRLETSDQLAAILGEMELYGLGPDEVDDFFTRIDAVTLDQANAAARKYFRTDGLSFVVLGNASRYAIT